jgi:MarR family transcriptional regulator, transcriptional regulator for hemolysin
MITSAKLGELVRQSMDLVTYRSWVDQMHFVKASGLSMPQLSILMLLYYRPTCGVSDISERMEITAAAASQLVDKLVVSSLLERIEDPHDRRAKQISLSTKGRNLINNNLKERHRWVDEFVRQLDAAQRAQVSQVMNIMIDALQQMQAPSNETE